MTEGGRHLPGARSEPTDIAERFIWAAIAAMAAMLVGCALLVRAMYPHADADHALKSPPPLYPAPRLQADPAADMRRARAAQMSRLNGSGLDETGFAHIPISQAMKLVAAEGVAGWPDPQ
ncbi:MAG TPA: hypothetical protein VHW71_16780 [Steroidobacteraceae bacterium]|jgi:hypothetical protein|nr:hypothetical protein [Steroidobacteraceae bacterium]